MTFRLHEFEHELDLHRGTCTVCREPSCNVEALHLAAKEYALFGYTPTQGQSSLQALDAERRVCAMAAKARKPALGILRKANVSFGEDPDVGIYRTGFGSITVTSGK